YRDRPTQAVEHVCATLIRLTLVHVWGGHHRCHHSQSLGLLTGGQPLGATEVRAAKSAHDATRPRLSNCPGDRVNAVTAFLELRVELALGGKPPAHILDHNNIASLYSTQNVERLASYGVF